MRSIYITLFFLSFCGSNPTLQMNLTSTVAAFSDANVVDMTFTFQNVPTSAGTLDQDKDGVPDGFVYPSDCGIGKPAGCGFSITSGTTITVGDLPLGYQYNVDVELRNAAGTALYDGTTVFNNLESSPVVTVNVD